MGKKIGGECITQQLRKRIHGANLGSSGGQLPSLALDADVGKSCCRSSDSHPYGQPASHYIVHNPMYHPSSKQILARYHFVRDRVNHEKEITVEKCAANQMGADMLTKHASVLGATKEIRRT